MPKLTPGQRIARRIGEATFDANRHVLEVQVAVADAGASVLTKIDDAGFPLPWRLCEEETGRIVAAGGGEVLLVSDIDGRRSGEDLTQVARVVVEVVNAAAIAPAKARAGLRQVGEGGPELGVSIDERDLVATVLCWAVVKRFTRAELNASLRSLGIDLMRHWDQLHSVELPASRAERS